MHKYLVPISESFSSNANDDYAFRMKKYMKDKFDYFGIKSPERKILKKAFTDEYGFPELSELDNIVKVCWQLPQREFQYFIMEVLGRLAKKAGKERIELYEYLIENKSWWDTVDYIASNLVGVHFRLYHDLIIPFTRKWMNSGNMWLQRTAILFQLKYRKDTDLLLLTDYIQQLQGSKEFFINKAIGWILREYSKTDPDWVVRFIEKNELANLSKREALKWMERKNIEN
ncbi:MAG: DNA alkylation repair protein [Deltaproteobacteria bacterium]|nr:MAG: DNA alkylation repair protein [Deltaproteobacteria bacterium]